MKWHEVWKCGFERNGSSTCEIGNTQLEGRKKYTTVRRCKEGLLNLVNGREEMRRKSALNVGIEETGDGKISVKEEGRRKNGEV